MSHTSTAVAVEPTTGEISGDLATSIERQPATFNTSRLRNAGSLQALADASREEILAEPQVHMSSVGFAEKHGSELTKLALEHLRSRLSPEDYARLRIDTKVHDMSPAQLPSIPGWHGDFVLRDEEGNICPEPERDSAVRHFLVVSGSPETQFIASTTPVVLPLSEKNWGEVNQLTNEMLERGEVRSFKVRAGQMVEFAADRLHRGVKSEQNEQHARYFFRASLFPEDHPAASYPLCETVRTHQQVYQEFSPEEHNTPLAMNAKGYSTKLTNFKLPKSPKQNEEIAKEPMLADCSIDFAEKAGGSITREFLTQLKERLSEDELSRARISTHVHMLSNSWQPGELPGWRSQTENGLEGQESKRILLSLNHPAISYVEARGEIAELQDGELLLTSAASQLRFAGAELDHGFQFSYRMEIEIPASERPATNRQGIQHTTLVPEGSWW